jgi:hypothetical protein
VIVKHRGKLLTENELESFTSEWMFIENNVDFLGFSRFAFRIDTLQEYLDNHSAIWQAIRKRFRGQNVEDQAFWWGRPHTPEERVRIKQLFGQGVQSRPGAESITTKAHRLIEHENNDTLAAGKKLYPADAERDPSYVREKARKAAYAGRRQCPACR